MSLNKSESKILKNLMIVAPKKDGSYSVFEKKYNTTMTFSTVDAAAEYIKKIMEDEEK